MLEISQETLFQELNVFLIMWKLLEKGNQL